MFHVCVFVRGSRMFSVALPHILPTRYQRLQAGPPDTNPLHAMQPSRLPSTEHTKAVLGT